MCSMIKTSSGTWLSFFAMRGSAESTTLTMCLRATSPLISFVLPLAERCRSQGRLRRLAGKSRPNAAGMMNA